MQAHPAHGEQRPPVLPEVLADRNSDSVAVDVDHQCPLARREVSELIEHPIVGQVVLVVPVNHRTITQHPRGIGRPAPGILTEPTNEYRQRTAARVRQIRRQ